MAKAFYSQSEAETALNTDEEGLKALTREGRLTEYRDGPNLMYKGTQVESLASERNDAVDLGDSGGPIGLADSSGASGSALGLADSSSQSRSGSGTGISGGSTGGGLMAKDDTAGGFTLSDSDDGVDPVMGSQAGASASGITIFGPDDSGIADPGAQTNLGDSSSEQVNLEGIGSGSGLLDLTQEPDDTSFGAETFDEIMPGESGMGTAVGYAHDDAGIDTGAAPAGTRNVAVAYEPADSSAPLFGGLAGGAAVVVLLGILAVAASAMGAAPGLLSMFFNENGTLNLAILLGVFLGLPILGLIVGMIGGKMSNA